MIALRPLTAVSWAQLAAAFNGAFADYAVPMAMSAESLAAMQVRRGFAAACSFGAFLGDGTRDGDGDGELVGFCLTGVEGERAYNGGTGVVPAHRRGQLGRRLVEAVMAQVTAHAGARSYTLEVIEDNGAAVALYRQLGFVETRRLQCWTLASPRSSSPPAPERGGGSPGGAPDGLRRASSLDEAGFLGGLLAEAELAPAWQNSLASIRRATERYEVIGDAHGAVVVFPGSGDVPLLCVRRASRRRGKGQQLLAAAAARAGRALRFINVDDRGAELSAFLSAAGATRTVRQLEMVRPLP